MLDPRTHLHNTQHEPNENPHPHRKRLSRATKASLINNDNPQPAAP